MYILRVIYEFFITIFQIFFENIDIIYYENIDSVTDDIKYSQLDFCYIRLYNIIAGDDISIGIPANGVIGIGPAQWCALIFTLITAILLFIIAVKLIVWCFRLVGSLTTLRN